jgi:hypothetical protein
MPRFREQVNLITDLQQDGPCQSNSSFPTWITCVNGLNLSTNTPFLAILGIKGRSRKLLSFCIGQTWLVTFRRRWHNVTLVSVLQQYVDCFKCWRVTSSADSWQMLGQSIFMDLITDFPKTS